MKKNIKVYVPIVGDVEVVVEQIIASWIKNNYSIDNDALGAWWNKYLNSL